MTSLQEHTGELFNGAEEFEHDSHEHESHEKASYGVKGSIIGVLALAATVFTFIGISKMQEKDREIKNSKLEGLLRGRGFDEAGITIDVKGDADRLKVGCTQSGASQTEVDPKTIEFFLNSDGDAYLKVEPQTDAGGHQELGDGSIINFSLGTSEQIGAFITGYLSDKCDYLLNK